MIRKIAMASMTGLALAACTPASSPDDAEPAPAADVSTPTETEEVTSAPAEAAPVIETEVEAEPAEIETIGYPEGWVLQPYWSGEYPRAFSVTQEGVTVMGHETITYEEYPPIYCGLPNKATYSPWNGTRRESDNLEFVAMVFPTTFTIMEDTSVEALVGDGAEPLELKSGDQLIYKNYIAEGFFIAEKDGVEYEINEADLPRSTEFEPGPDDHEWVLVTCADAAQTRAWVRYEDALSANGVEPYEYTAFAMASDLP
jgi:hypothetical protein